MYQDDSDQAQAALSALFGSQGGGSDIEPASSAPESPTDASFDSVEEIEAALMSDGSTPEDVASSQAVKKTKRTIPPGTLVVYLLKGYVDREEHPLVYESILSKTAAVNDLCKQLSLQLIVDYDAGYAYVKSMDEEDITTTQGIRPPRLLVKRQLSFFASFILILLRQRLLDFEVSGNFGQFVLERQSIIDQVKAYVLNVNNDIKLTERINKGIDDLCDLGVLKAINVETEKTVVDRILVKRIINAIVTPTVLSNVEEILKSYVDHINEGSRNNSW